MPVLAYDLHRSRLYIVQVSVDGTGAMFVDGELVVAVSRVENWARLRLPGRALLVSFAVYERLCGAIPDGARDA
jgi:hypothetical protein